MFEEVEIYTMIPGHTKFSPDRHFGWMKNRFSTTDKVECHRDCLLTVEESSKKNQVIDLMRERVKIYNWD